MSIKATTPLEIRMAQHTPGQITWPEPAIGRYCDACRHYYTGDTANVEKGRCDLVRLHHRGITGKQFKGADAKACPQFEEGQHMGNQK